MSFQTGYLQLRNRGKLSAVSAMLLFLAGCGAGDGSGLNINGQPIDDNAVVGGGDDLYSEVQTIFDARCTVCHSGAAAPQGLILTEDQSFSAIVNVNSTQQSDLLLVNPGDADSSYLVQKILGTPGITGAQMPRNGPPFLSTSQIETIVNWVNQGAPEPLKPDANAEYVASLSDFSNYRSWEAVDYSIGPTNLALGSAHQGSVLTHSRRVFANDTALMSVGEEFDNGSIFVKEIVTLENGSREFAESGGLLAMVKRGQDFNAENNGWEWFVLSPDLSQVLDRGANVMEDGCNVCHQQADLEESGSLLGGNDYIFRHPSEFIATAADFSDYTSWALIDDRNDANPLLDGMAHGATEDGSVRKVYKRQLFANPDTEAQGYPIGTMFAKEVTLNGEVIEITGMVKRGSDFNPDYGSWEWFMLDPDTLDIMTDVDGNIARGANLMNGMCNGCHFAANPTSGNGIDLVFKHGGDPFNNNEEFFAELANFENYSDWSLVDYTIGAVVPGIGAGHRGLEDEYARLVYANDEAVSFENTVYPKGSIFVKEVVTWENGQKEFAPALGLVAMAKRGGNFNSEFGGWEWFELDNNLSQIIGRGDDYRDNGCNNCHSQVIDSDIGADYVFEHPSEFVAGNDHFTDYRDWLLIDERNDQNNLLGGMAHGADDPETVRRVYKKQDYANPLDNGIGYPVGTTIVKEVLKGNDIVELGAMVKRGGEFNSDHNHWEWFVLDSDTALVEQDGDGNDMRGADLMGGMCNSCHTIAANDANEGSDYVFDHINDPVRDAM